MTPPLRRRIQVIAIFVSAAILLLISICATLSGFLAWHVLTTRPYHKIPLYFSYSNSTPKALTAYTPLFSRGLRSVQQLSASIELHVPESDTNLDNSVFHLNAELFGTQDVTGKQEICLARGSAQAVLRFRSQVHRAIRAVSLSIPLLLGITREYQRVEAGLLEYRAIPGEDGWLPQLDGIRVEILPAEVQVAQAMVRLRVVRRSFVAGMWNERRASTFVVVMLIVWYAMVAGMFLLIWLASMVQVVLKRVWEGVWEGETEGEKSLDVFGGNGGGKEVASGALPPRFGKVGGGEGRRGVVMASGSIIDGGVRRRGVSYSGKPR